MDDLAEFIKKYGKPYDPETDDYNVGPFQKNFDNASKSSKIYNMHMYWTKQDPYVVKEFIEHYTKPGDIVLDAFCGTGMTGVAAMMCGRHAILCDISPACIHIAKNYTTPINPLILKDAYFKLMEKVETEIRPLYKTRCHNCGYEDAQIANTILSDVFKCPRCSNEVLYAGDGRWERMRKGEKFRKIRCRNCGYEFSKARAEFVRIEPIEIRVNCKRCKIKGEAKAKPLDEHDWKQYIEIEGGKRFISPLGEKVLNQLLEERGLNEIPPKEPPYWYPKDVKFPMGYNTRQPLKRGITHPYQMFSRRNLIALSILWEGINRTSDQNARNKLVFNLTASMFLMSMMSRWKKSPKQGHHIGPAIRMGTLYIPSLIQDVNVLEYFENKCKSNFEIPFLKSTSIISLSKQSATGLKNVPNETIDYLFYDPPYGGNINYSELNLMWEAWLGEYTNINEEIVENEYQEKGRQEYQEMMLNAMKEAFRVLKPDRWITMVYSYADPSMYRTIQHISQQAGFLNEGDILHVASARKTKSQLDSDKAQQRFLVINFKKPKRGETKEVPKAEDIEYEVIKVIQDFLTKHPGKTRDYIYDQVIKRLFTSVKIQKFNLDEILKNFFRKVGNEWYAPGSLIKRSKTEPKRGENLPLFRKETPEHPEKEVILRLQEFLKKYGRVPYSELREYYLRKINNPLERNFDELIKENFIVEQGKVRLPTHQEQEQMQDVTIRYKTRLIKRFLDGKLDRMPDDREVCDWIEFCYKNGLYSEGARLFPGIRADMVSEDIYAKTKKIAEVCRIKAE